MGKIYLNNIEDMDKYHDAEAHQCSGSGADGYTLSQTFGITFESVEFGSVDF